MFNFFDGDDAELARAIVESRSFQEGFVVVKKKINLGSKRTLKSFLWRHKLKSRVFSNCL